MKDKDKSAITKKTGASKGTPPPRKTNGHSTMLTKGVPANVEVMTRALKKFDVAVPKTVEGMRDALRTRFEGHHDLECTTCGEWSNDECEDCCPFCGDEGEIAAADGAAPAAPVDLPPAPKSSAKKPKGKAVAEPTAIVASSEDDDAHDGVVVEKIEQGIAAKLAQLEKHENEIRRIALDVKGNYYDLAIEIKKVHEGDLWKAKGYESFEKWATIECQFRAAYAWQLVRMVSQFDRPTFQKVGVSKLLVVSTAKDEEEKKELLKRAKSGASRSELRKEKKGDKSKAPEKESKKDAPKKTNDITLLAKVNGKATSHGFKSGETGRPIKAFKDGAFAEVPLAKDGGVVMRIAPQFDKEGALVGVTVAFVKAE